MRGRIRRYRSSFINWARHWKTCTCSPISSTSATCCAAILANMVEGVFVVDEGGRVLLANEAATLRLGVHEGDVLRAELAQLGADPAPQAEAAPDALVQRRDRPLLAYGGRSFGVTMSALAATTICRRAASMWPTTWTKRRRPSSEGRFRGLCLSRNAHPADDDQAAGAPADDGPRRKRPRPTSI